MTGIYFIFKLTSIKYMMKMQVVEPKMQVQHPEAALCTATPKTVALDPVVQDAFENYFGVKQ